MSEEKGRGDRLLPDFLRESTGSDICLSFTDEEISPLLWFTLESAVDEVYWLNAAGTIRFANHKAARNLGWPRNDLVGMNIAYFQRDMPEEDCGDRVSTCLCPCSIPAGAFSLFSGGIHVT